MPHRGNNVANGGCKPTERKENKMRFIAGSMDIRLSLEEVNTINDLIKRDTAKAIAQKVIADSTYECCPNCGKMLFSKHNFCEECGQRLDFENKAL